MPTNSIVTIHNQTVMVHPIMDQYYDRNPHHRRSAAYVRTKGLAANEKASARLGTAVPAATPPIEIETQKKFLPVIPFSNTRSRTPESSVPKVRTPLSHIEPAPNPVDVRSVTVPPSQRPTQPQPAQGNIKKKRTSLTTIEAISGAPSLQEQSPVTPERTDFAGNPTKIAQFFPELSIS